MPAVLSPGKILVTGAAGNVGRNVTAALRAAGHVVRTFDRVVIPGDPDQVTGDLADRSAVERAVAGVQTVVHFGGNPRMEAEFIRDLIKPNVEGLWHILDCARLAGVRRFIFASSSNTAFGATGLSQLKPETIHPLNPYGATKVLGENLGRWFHDTYGMEFLAVRIGYFSGTYEEPALAELFVRRIWLGPEDCGRFFRLAIEAAPFGYGVVYACSRCPENYLDLTSARELIGYEPEEIAPAAPGAMAS